MTLFSLTMFEWLRLALLITLAGLLVVAAVGDVRRYTIPNRLCGLIALLALPYWLVTAIALDQPLWPLFGTQLLIGLCAFVALAALFALKVMGGGDVKLMAAITLWLPLAQLWPFAIWIALAGGAVAIILLLVRKPQAGVRRSVPYGVAIATGGIIMAAEPIVKMLSA